MAKSPKKTLDESSLRAMASLATSSSDLSKLQENLGWNKTEETTPASEPVQPEKAEEQPAPAVTFEQTEAPPIAPEQPAKPQREPSATTSDRKVDKYANNFLQPIKGFERPTKVAYISKRSHSYVAMLGRYASVMGSKVSLQEIMENIFRQHFTEHRAEIEAMRAVLEQKEAELREW